MRSCTAVATSVLVWLSPSSARAQQPIVLPGARVRVTLTDTPRAEGTVTFVSRDSIVVATSPSVRTTIRATSVRQIDQFAGHSHVAGAVRGATLMGIVGAVLVGSSAPRSREEACPVGSRASCRPLTRLESAAAGAILFGMLGEWIGGIVGRDQWRRATIQAPAPTAPMSSAPVRLPALDPGLRIRITAPGVVTDGLEGTVIQSTVDSLTLATPKGVRFDIPKSAIVEVRRPVVSASAGARVGAGWGAAVYAPMSPLVVALSDGHDGSALAGMVQVTAVGTGVGAMIGALKGRETWEVIRP